MATPNLYPFILQLASKAFVVVGVAAVLGIVGYELRAGFESWIDRKARRSTSKPVAKRYEGMSDDEVLGAPRCPNCEGTMVVRTAWKNRDHSEKFWGCNSFPECRGTRQVSRQ